METEEFKWQRRRRKQKGKEDEKMNPGGESEMAKGRKGENEDGE